MAKVNFENHLSSNIPEAQPTAWSVAKEYVRTSAGMRNLVVSPLLRGVKWVKYAQGGLSETGIFHEKVLKNSMHGLYWLDFPSGITKIGKSFVKLKNSLYSGSLSDIAFRTQGTAVRTALLFDFLADAVKILDKEKFVQLSSSQLAFLDIVGFFGSAALFCQAMYGLKKQVTKLMNAEKGSPEYKLALIRIALRISLAAIGVFGMVAFLYGSIIPQFVLLSTSTILLIAILSSRFYDKLYVSTQKNS